MKKAAVAAGTATVGAVDTGAVAAGAVTSDMVEAGAMTSGTAASDTDASGAVPAAMPVGEEEVPISSMLGWMGGGGGGDESVLIERAIST